MPTRPDRPSRPALSVLRVGHRPGRDPRVTTHVALVARAWGANEMFLHPADDGLAHRLRSVGRRWGGRFRLTGVSDWRTVIDRFPGIVVHLTMYGEPLDGVARDLRRAERLLVVIGGAKVPAELFQRAHRNVSVGTQPHSEVAALAVFLDRLGGLPPDSWWRGARHRIVPSPRGKRVRTMRGAKVR